MIIQIMLFGVLRECAGQHSVDLELEEGANVADALRALRADGQISASLSGLSLAMAVNRQYADMLTTLEPDDELALIPPLSGGA